MNFLKISGRTRRDDKSKTIIYHVSPNKMNRFQGRSSFFGISGLFFGPSYNSIAKDWAEYVISKKNNKHPLGKTHQEVLHEMRLYRHKELSEEETIKFNNLKDKLDRINETMDSDAYQRSIGNYSKVYVHKVSCPKRILNDSIALMNEAYNSGYKEDDFGFWGWGAQVFIPQDFLNQLEVVGVEEWNNSKVAEESHKSWTKRYIQD